MVADGSPSRARARTVLYSYPMALRAGILCSYAVMLEPVMMHSWAGGSRYSRSE